MIVVKRWAKNAGINDAKFSTLSSYTLTLMVLHYLQVGVGPQPVIPCLNQLYPRLFHPESNVFALPFKPEKLPQFSSFNRWTLGELLLDFFRYYNLEFNFMAHCGSIRLGQALDINECYQFSKARRDNPGQWNAYICMEDPFQRSNVGRAIIKRDKFDKIVQKLQTSYNCLLSHNCLNCFMNRCSSK